MAILECSNSIVLSFECDLCHHLSVLCVDVVVVGVSSVGLQSAGDFPCLFHTVFANEPSILD